jgi:hypothetical protein
MAACPRLVPDCDCDAECCKVADALALLSDNDLAQEIARRDAKKITAYWVRRAAEAKYLCPDCGGPDSSHTVDCPSDTDCT